MANRAMAMRYISRRFSKGSRILSEEERAAENVYIQRKEREQLERLARQGPKPEETTTAAASSGASGPVTDAKPPSDKKSSTPGVSTDKYRNYGVLAGIVTGLGAFGWYMLSKDQKTEVVQD